MLLSLGRKRRVAEVILLVRIGTHLSARVVVVVVSVGGSVYSDFDIFVNMLIVIIIVIIISIVSSIAVVVIVIINLTIACIIVTTFDYLFGINSFICVIYFQ